MNEEINKISREDKLFLFDYGYIHGLIDMAYMTGLLTRIEKKELKERVELKNLGKEGEQLFRQLMEQKGYLVQDVSGDPHYWEKDIDFLITSPTGETKSFEVKRDAKINRTGNLYLEIANKNSEGALGWWEFCKADYLAYGNAITKTFYVIKMDDLRAKVDSMKHKHLGFCGADSAGYLIHISQLAGLFQYV